MQRLASERGAVSVMVALLMIPLMIFAALAIDVAAMHAERQQLQTGADAAALAIAQDCARNSCGSPALTAQSFAMANSNDGAATADVTPVPTPASGRVTVRTAGVSEHAFGSVLGIDETAITATATASWGAPRAGTAILPVAFSLCEFLAQTGGGLPSGSTERTIFFTKSSTTTCKPNPSGNLVPGGFGWLQPNAGRCGMRSAIGDILWSDTGANVPSGCTTGDFAAAQNKTVLLPLFDDAGDSGSNAWYRLYGYAAFQVTGYHFVGQYSWSETGTCKGSVRCIQGYFVQFVDLTDAFEYGPAAPQLGAAVIFLTE